MNKKYEGMNTIIVQRQQEWMFASDDDTMAASGCRQNFLWLLR